MKNKILNLSFLKRAYIIHQSIIYRLSSTACKNKGVKKNDFLQSAIFTITFIPLKSTRSSSSPSKQQCPRHTCAENANFSRARALRFRVLVVTFAILITNKKNQSVEIARAQTDAGVHGDGRIVRDLAAEARLRAPLVPYEAGGRALPCLLVDQHTLHQQLRQHGSACENFLLIGNFSPRWWSSLEFNNRNELCWTSNKFVRNKVSYIEQKANFIAFFISFNFVIKYLKEIILLFSKINIDKK